MAAAPTAYEHDDSPHSSPDSDVAAPEMRMEIETTATIGKLVAALAKAQHVMEGAKRDQNNPNVGKKYADLASCWEAWRPAGPPNGLALIQIPCNPRPNVVVVKTILACGEERITSTLTMPVAEAMINKDRQERGVTAQTVGSAITYARRYSFMAMVGIAPEEDDGNSASGRPNDRGANQNGGADTRGQSSTTTGSSKTATEPRKVDFGPIEVLDVRGWIERARTINLEARRKWWGSQSGARSRELWGKDAEKRVLAAMHAIENGDDIDADGVVVPKAPSDPKQAQSEPGAAG
jgi:hypothetical protein